MPPQNAPDPSNAGLTPSAKAIERFRRDLGALIDIERDTLLVAVSGGPDSLALLLLAHAALGDRCFAATVDHGLRLESRTEAKWVARLCAGRDIDHRILADDLPHRAGRTTNLSARARKLRYGLLDQHAAELGGAWIATAHHADDQLETVLMRLNRGAGVGGLAAIRPSGWRVVRPLLAWRSAELATIVTAAGLSPVDDPTNRDDRFDRARLRKNLDGADWLNPAGLATSTAALAEADEALIWATQRLAADHIIEDSDKLTLSPAGIPAELIRRLVRLCVQRVNPKAGADGPSYARLIDGLIVGHAATISDVIVSVDGDSWTFRPAPPRRNT